jgi:hypothetical protein
MLFCLITDVNENGRLNDEASWRTEKKCGPTTGLARPTKYPESPADGRDPAVSQAYVQTQVFRMKTAPNPNPPTVITP